MKIHYKLFILVCILCILISIIDIVYPLDIIFIRIKEVAFTLSLFLVALIDFFNKIKKREARGYVFLIVSFLAFTLSLYKVIIA